MNHIHQPNTSFDTKREKASPVLIPEITREQETLHDEMVDLVESSEKIPTIDYRDPTMVSIAMEHAYGKDTALWQKLQALKGQTITEDTLNKTYKITTISINGQKGMKAFTHNGTTYTWNWKSLLNNWGIRTRKLQQETRGEQAQQSTPKLGLQLLLKEVMGIMVEQTEKNGELINYQDSTMVSLALESAYADTPALWQKLQALKGQTITEEMLGKTYKVNTYGINGQRGNQEFTHNNITYIWNWGSLLQSWGNITKKLQQKTGGKQATQGIQKLGLQLLLKEVMGINMERNEIGKTIDYQDPTIVSLALESAYGNDSTLWNKLQTLKGQTITEDTLNKTYKVNTTSLNGQQGMKAFIHNGTTYTWNWYSLLTSWGTRARKLQQETGGAHARQGIYKLGLQLLLKEVMGITLEQRKQQGAPIDYQDPTMVSLALESAYTDIPALWQKLQGLKGQTITEETLNTTYKMHTVSINGQKGMKEVTINGTTYIWHWKSLLQSWGRPARKLQQKNGSKQATQGIQKLGLQLLLKEVMGIMVEQTEKNGEFIDYQDPTMVSLAMEDAYGKDADLWKKLQALKGSTVTEEMLGKTYKVHTRGINGQQGMKELTHNGTTYTWNWRSLLNNWGIRAHKLQQKTGGEQATQGIPKLGLQLLLKEVMDITLEQTEQQGAPIDYQDPTMVSLALESAYTDIPALWQKLQGLKGQTITEETLNTTYKMHTVSINGQKGMKEVTINGTTYTWNWASLLISWGNIAKKLQQKTGGKQGTQSIAKLGLQLLLKEIMGITIVPQKTQEAKLEDALMAPESTLLEELQASYTLFGEWFGTSVLRDLIIGDLRFQDLPLELVEQKLKAHLGLIRTPTGVRGITDAFLQLSEVTLSRPGMHDLAVHALKRYGVRTILAHNKSFLTGHEDTYVELYELLEEKLLIPTITAGEAHQRVITEVMEYFLALLTFKLPPHVRRTIEVKGMTRPYPSLNQLIHIFETVQSRRRLNADEVGTGKTGAALGASAFARRVLIVVPDQRIAGQWKNTMSTFFTETPPCHILDDLVFPQEMAEDQQKNDPTQYMIVSLPGINGTTPEKRRELMRQLSTWNYDMLIIDEAHRAKNAETASVELIKTLVDGVAEGGMVNELTATPVPNLIDDLAMRLWVTFPDIQVTVRADGTLRYTEGFGIIPEEDTTEQLKKTLKECSLSEIKHLILNQPNFIRNLFYRRTQCHSLEEIRGIPPAQIETKLSTMDHHQQIMTELMLDDHELFAGDKIWGLQAITQDTYGHFGLRPELLNPKREALRQEITALLPEKAHIVIFGNQWSQGITSPYKHKPDAPTLFDELRLSFPEVAVDVLNDKKKSSADVEAIRRTALTQGQSITLVSGSIGAEGLDNLSFAQHVIIYNPPWNKARMDQEIGRVRRPDVHRETPVTVTVMATKDSIEEGILELIAQKEEAIQAVLTGGSLTDLQKLLLSTSDLRKVIKHISAPGLGHYLLSSGQRINRFFGAVKALSKTQFMKRLELIGKEYAELYRIRPITSYHAMHTRGIATLWKSLGVTTSGGWIADLASGPQMLKRALGKESNIISIDANPHHFTSEEITKGEAKVAHLTALPIDSASCMGVNLSLCLQDLYLNTKDEIYDRPEALVEAVRILKTGGHLIISLSHGVAVASPKALNAFISWMEQHLGVLHLPSYTGQMTVPDKFLAHVLTFQKVQDIHEEKYQQLREDEGETSTITPHELTAEIVQELIQAPDLKDLFFDIKRREDTSHFEKARIVYGLHDHYLLTPYENTKSGSPLILPITLTPTEQEYLTERTHQRLITSHLKKQYKEVNNIPKAELEKHHIITIEVQRKTQETKHLFISTKGLTQGEYWE